MALLKKFITGSSNFDSISAIGSVERHSNSNINLLPGIT